MRKKMRNKRRKVRLTNSATNVGCERKGHLLIVRIQTSPVFWEKHMNIPKNTKN